MTEEVCNSCGCASERHAGLGFTGEMRTWNDAEAEGYVKADDYDKALSLVARQAQEIQDLRTERETLDLKLAACSVAALGNTPAAVAQRIAPGHPYYSASYGDVCRTVDREMELRSSRDALREALKELRAVVMGECPSLLNEDSGGDARLALTIDQLLADSQTEDPLKEV